MEDFPPKYEPKGIEDKWNDFWERERIFTPVRDPGKKPYTISIPPPNVTGRLTLGHVLNNTVQDILIRYKKMNGFETLWVAGMDHAGIATQVVVEERLLAKGIKRIDLGRDKFVAEVWKWKEEYASVIRSQLKKMGCGLDWSRERFTLDDHYAQTVIKVFIDLYDKKLIYRGLKIINWCPRCLTTLSNEQVETEEKNGHLYYIKYPVKGSSDFLTIATTRPETMLGDTAVCVNPKDPRYRAFIGRTAILPLMDREIPIIADEYVDIEFGTGCLKVTPAHDPFDFELSKKHKLEIVNIMNPDASINENGGPFKGLDRYAARKAVIAALKEAGLFEKIEDYRVPLSTCERCRTAVEPKLSRQWFVKMKPLAEPAIAAVRDGRIKIHPRRWVNLYNHWLENVQDWPISRQLWWGHRMPIYYCRSCFDPEADLPKGVMVSAEKPARCPDCGGSDIRQDEDVLDTWFSSWLWPFATLGWPDRTPDYERYYPTQTLATGWDIIYLWVARMIMAGLEFTGSIPFSNVVFHTMIRDEKGRKMSKSLGNSPDPLDLIDRYGADSLRFGILLITPREQDVLFTEKSLEVGQKFCNKLWNAARMVSINFPDHAGGLPAKPGPYDLWIIEQFNGLLGQMEGHYQEFQLNAIAKKLYAFVWHVFCDWYLEFVKVEPHARNNAALFVLRRILLLLHPFMPFITEEIHQRMPGRHGSVLREAWPARVAAAPAPPAVPSFIRLIEEVRNVRGMFHIKPKALLDLTVSADEERASFIKEDQALLKKLAGVGNVAFGAAPSGPVATVIIPSIHAYVGLPGVDISREKPRLEDEIKALSGRIEDVRGRLSNPQYLAKAEEEIKSQDAERLATMLRKKEAIEKAIERL